MVQVLSKAETLRRKQAIRISGVGTIPADEIADWKGPEGKYKFEEK